ncbi:DUF1643 domain-containing protein [Helicobacter sp. 11S03491-1]|uniref:DUF1643 domain-containing protein n=1 Tax=Helicobacter sp. 11S03491-1 TaxID=1476196 RepID=UPI000BA57628|nr:DUF1643 domain-containing protein [Helicobacter sp. 11S03491-1]PAF43751.1 hypothetical protein BKH45_00345 [Helicobacter sp. 11S03491-1]
MLCRSDKIGSNYEFFSIFSQDNRYRFVLERTWDTHKPKIALITLSPENANSDYWDSTLLVCKEFAMMLEDGKYGGLYLLNLYPYITSKTTDLIEYNGEMFEKNIAYIRHCVKNSEKVFCAWGDNVFRRAGKLKQHTQLASKLLMSIQDYQYKIYCFGVLKSSHPCHVIPKDGGNLLWRFLQDLKNGSSLKKYLYKGLKDFS